MCIRDRLNRDYDYELWLYVLDADWSDLIEISDVTHTVYISFVARAAASSERHRPVVRNVFLALIL